MKCGMCGKEVDELWTVKVEKIGVMAGYYGICDDCRKQIEMIIVEDSVVFLKGTDEKIADEVETALREVLSDDGIDVERDRISHESID